MQPDPPDTRRALLLVTGKARESDEVTFTEMFDDLGTTSIGAILDQADAALAPNPPSTTVSGVDL